MENFQNHQTPEPNNNFSFQDNIRVADAVIQNVTADRNAALVTISYNDCPACRPQTQVTLIVNGNTDIRNRDGRNIPAGNLEPGMTIDAVFSRNMTRSIPPQAQAFQIRVKNPEPDFSTTVGRILEVNTRGQFILTISNGNPSTAIRFNVTPETRILDPIGRTIPLSNLIPGLRVRVEHAIFMTLSLPPQTTAFTIRVIR